MAILEVEQMPFTVNDRYLQASIEKWLSRYKDQRAGKTFDSDELASKRHELAGKLAGNQPATPAPMTKSVDLCKLGLIYHCVFF